MLEYILLGVGIIFLIKGADFLVEGSSSLAKKFGVSPLIIGLTVVAFGTSMPELVVNVMAAINGTGDVAFGNIIGSNMSNILLILGASALIMPLAVKRSTVWKEIPFSLLAVMVLLVFANTVLLDGFQIDTLLRAEGLVLLFLFIIFLYYAFGMTRPSRSEEEKSAENNDNGIKEHSGLVIAAMIGAGLAGLYFGGQWTVDGAVAIAQAFGLSEFLISATIIAIGTSLPELITAITAVLKKNVDLAVGNVVGSNIFNILWILGLTATIRPLVFPAQINMDLLMLLLATFLLFVFMFVGKRHKLERWQGVVFVATYVAYIVMLIYRG
jgi:cation:H+ antiporter